MALACLRPQPVLGRSAEGRIRGCGASVGCGGWVVARPRSATSPTGTTPSRPAARRGVPRRPVCGKLPPSGRAGVAVDPESGWQPREGACRSRSDVECTVVAAIAEWVEHGTFEGRRAGPWPAGRRRDRLHRARAMKADEVFSDQLEGWLGSDAPKTLGGLGAVFAEKSFAVTVLLLMFVPSLPRPT